MQRKSIYCDTFPSVRKGFCNWRNCKSRCETIDDFVQHLHTEHGYSQRSTEECQEQIEVVAEIHAIWHREHRRLVGMLEHMENLCREDGQGECSIICGETTAVRKMLHSTETSPSPTLAFERPAEMLAVSDLQALQLSRPSVVVTRASTVHHEAFQRSNCDVSPGPPHDWVSGPIRSGGGPKLPTIPALKLSKAASPISPNTITKNTFEEYIRFHHSDEDIMASPSSVIETAKKKQRRPASSATAKDRHQTASTYDDYQPNVELVGVGLGAPLSGASSRRLKRRSSAVSRKRKQSPLQLLSKRTPQELTEKYGPNAEEDLNRYLAFLNSTSDYDERTAKTIHELIAASYSPEPETRGSEPRLAKRKPNTR